MIDIKKVIAVVVTYNRKEKLKKNIECLLNQTYNINEIYIIDNHSTDGTKRYINKYIEEKKINYIDTLENLGGAGGFAKALDIAQNSENDYVWGMDDDAYPKEDALEELMKYATEDKVLWSNCNKDGNFNSADTKQVKSFMFVGFLIPIKIIKRLGLPRADFFIYYDDVEYSKRITKNGYKILKVKNSIIDHQDTVEKTRNTKQILCKKISYNYLPSWKQYYFVRNIILMYKWNDIEKYKVIFVTMIKYFIKMVIFNDKNKKMFFKGYFDGIRNKSGIIVKP